MIIKKLQLPENDGFDLNNWARENLKKSVLLIDSIDSVNRIATSLGLTQTTSEIYKNQISFVSKDLTSVRLSFIVVERANGKSSYMLTFYYVPKNNIIYTLPHSILSIQNFFLLKFKKY